MEVKWGGAGCPRPGRGNTDPQSTEAGKLEPATPLDHGDLPLVFGKQVVRLHVTGAGSGSRFVSLIHCNVPAVGMKNSNSQSSLQDTINAPVRT